MKQFIKKVLTEIQTNKKFASEPLMKMLVESTNKSIALGQDDEQIYSDLKRGLVTINENIDSPELDALVSQIYKNDESLDAKVDRIAKEMGIFGRIEELKTANAYANPMLKTQIDSIEKELHEGVSDFAICGKFIDSLSAYTYDAKVKEIIESTQTYINKNYSKLLVLSAISQMSSVNSPAYAGALNDLKTMLVNEAYTADILKLKYGNSIPVIASLISQLRIVEANQMGYFTLGEGNKDNFVSSVVAPSIKTKDGMILYIDNRFLSIREAKGLTGNETKIHIDEDFKISDFSPEYVKENHEEFYSFCEAYATLGFNKAEDGLGVESNGLRTFKIGLRMNESRALDLYINGEKVGSAKDTNLSEALALETQAIRTKVNTVLENSKMIYNFDFIKEVNNSRVMKDAYVLNLNNNYFICEKLDAANRQWSKVDEYEMYEHFKNNYGYDISSIFKVKIDESIELKRKIEERKKQILVDIEKLEASTKKLDEAASAPGLDPTEISKLESIKESIEQTIGQMKEDYIQIDLLKKKELV